MSEEEVKLLLRVREEIERRIGRLEEEVRDLRRALEEVDALIVRSGFRRPSPSKKEVEGPVEAVPLKAKDGTVLATMYIGEREVRVTPSEGLNFTMNIPPFRSFFLDRVLSGMRSSDEERVGRGEISPDETLSFQVATEGDRITGLTVRNFGGERRLREIRSALRWTLEKMYEKMTSS